MLAIATAVCDRIRPGLRDDPILVQRIDEAIYQNAPSVKVNGEAFQLAQFELEIQYALARCTEKMADSIGSVEAIDHFLVAGGGAARLAEQLSRTYPKRTVVVDQEPVYSNLRGFFVAGELLHAARQ